MSDDGLIVQIKTNINTAACKVLQFKIASAICNQDPGTAMNALIVCARQLGLIFGEPYIGQFRAAVQLLDPAHEFKSATQAADESLHTQKDTTMDHETLYAKLSDVQQSVHALQSTIETVTRPTGPLITTAQRLIDKLDSFNPQPALPTNADNSSPSTAQQGWLDNAVSQLVETVGELKQISTNAQNLLTEIKTEIEPAPEPSPEPSPEPAADTEKQPEGQAA